MTEDEAKRKWCPMVRFAGAQVAFNRDTQTPEYVTRCIGSECMMWRETSAPPITGKFHGYCGLGGKP